MWNTIICSIDSMPIESALEDLSGNGEIRVCETGKEVLIELSTGKYDLVICDEEMPNLNLWQLSRVIGTGSICASDTILIGIKDEITGETMARSKDHRITILPRDDIADLGTVICRLRNSNRRPSVLVVEDNDVMREMLRQYLEKEYDVDVAPDGETGMRKWQEVRHNLLILDLMLPEMSGEDVLREVRAVNPEQPAIILTAFATQDRHIELVLAGAEEFLEKPVTAEKLRESCARILRYTTSQTSAPRPLPNIRNLAARLWHIYSILGSGEDAQALAELRDVLESLSQYPVTDEEWIALLD